MFNYLDFLLSTILYDSVMIYDPAYCIKNNKNQLHKEFDTSIFFKVSMSSFAPCCPLLLEPVQHKINSGKIAVIADVATVMTSACRHRRHIFNT